MEFTIQTDIWHYLSRTAKSIVMYGMGNGADKILSVCSQYGIEVSDFFASDEFVRGHSFHGKTVLSYSRICEKYGRDNIIVLLSFATNRPEVMANVCKIASECELYAPDVPVFGDSLFNFEFYTAYKSEFDRARGLFTDEKSVELFDSIIEYKLSGNIRFLRNPDTDKSDIYANILGAQNFETVMDLGAYNGDTIREIITYAPYLKNVFAFEPDPHSFSKLNAYAHSQSDVNINTIPACAWDTDTELIFDISGNRNAGAAGNTSAVTADRIRKTRAVPAKTADSVAGDTHIDYIKYDVEGSERRALLGSAGLIRRDSPALLVSAYHRSEDLFDLPMLISELNPLYSLYLRRTPYIPAWDIHLLAVAK